MPRTAVILPLCGPGAKWLMQCFGSEGLQRGGGSCSTYILHTYLHPGQFLCEQNSFVVLHSNPKIKFGASLAFQFVDAVFWLRGAPAWSRVLTYCAYIYTLNLFCGRNSFIMIKLCQVTLFSLSFSFQRLNVHVCPVFRGAPAWRWVLLYLHTGQYPID